MLLASAAVTHSERVGGRASVPGGSDTAVAPIRSSAGLLPTARSTSCLAAARTGPVDVLAAAGRVESTSASCRAAGMLRRHCLPTRCSSRLCAAAEPARGRSSTILGAGRARRTRLLVSGAQDRVAALMVCVVTMSLISLTAVRTLGAGGRSQTCCNTVSC